VSYLFSIVNLFKQVKGSLRSTACLNEEVVSELCKYDGNYTKD